MNPQALAQLALLIAELHAGLIAAKQRIAELEKEVSDAGNSS